MRIVGEALSGTEDARERRRSQEIHAADRRHRCELRHRKAPDLRGERFGLLTREAQALGEPSDGCRAVLLGRTGISRRVLLQRLGLRACLVKTNGARMEAESLTLLPLRHPFSSPFRLKSG